MAVVRDWTRVAAEEIITEVCLRPEPTTITHIRDIIRKHCPFAEGVAYIEYDELATSVKVQNALDEIRKKVEWLVENPPR